jgi:putative Ca2+/H+ antiporter (TMEM165/GDT1 family)
VESFLISLSTVAIAEVGDRTQLLSLMLAAHYRKPWPILAGVLCATLFNHAVAGLIGSHLGRFLTPRTLDVIVGVSMVAMALWSLKPDSLEQSSSAMSRTSAFVATFVGFFLAEIGDKTQLATLALAAAYPNLVLVVAGTTAGMIVANAPAIFLGHAFAGRLPIRVINYVASGVFLLLGVVFIERAIRG